MSARVGRVLVITAASLVWLAGCETTSSLNPFKSLIASGPDGQLADPAATGSVPPPLGEPTSTDPAMVGSVAPPPGEQSEADPATTGSVTPPPGAPIPTTPELLGSDPNDDVSLAKKYFRQGSYGLAERQFRKAVELYPKDAEAWLGLAASYDWLRRFDLADRAYRQAIRLAGATPEILNNQGFSYLLRGDHARARSILLAAQAKDPASPYIQNNLLLLEQSLRKKKAVN
jgi:tetratricopeptide (TPR) repeat protein